MSITALLSDTEFITVHASATVTARYSSDVAGQCVGAHTCGGRLGGTMGMAHGPPFASAGSSHVGADTLHAAVRCAPLDVLDSFPCVSG